MWSRISLIPFVISIGVWCTEMIMFGSASDMSDMNSEDSSFGTFSINSALPYVSPSLKYPGKNSMPDGPITSFVVSPAFPRLS